jgi:anti-sigma regulatory factor (Ser/Thr protein kinase)
VGLRLELGADVGELSRLADAVDAFASAHGLDAGTAGRLTVALDEVVTNAIVHGRLPAGAVIGVELEVEGGEVVGTVSDSGPAFDPLAAPPVVDAAAPLEGRPVGGLGLFLVHQLCRDLAYRREGACNRLTMRLACAGAPRGVDAG